MNFYHLKYLLALVLVCFGYYVNAKSTIGRDNSNSTSLSLRESRIYGGSPINIADASYQVTLRLKLLETIYYGYGFICSGAVISQRVVLTTARCIVRYTLEYGNNPGLFTVVMGSDELFARPNNSLQYDILKMVVHEDFISTPVDNDLALLFIRGYIPWNATVVHAIPLNLHDVNVGVNCIVTGFGTTETSLGPSSELIAANMPIVSNAVCGTNYNMTIREGHLCAGYMGTGNVSICGRDAGNPLVCDGLLTGIASWGIGCGQINSAGVFNNISNYYSWIVLTNSTFDYSFYGDVGGDDDGDGAMAVFGQSKWLVCVGMLFSLLFSGV